MSSGCVSNWTLLKHNWPNRKTVTYTSLTAVAVFAPYLVKEEGIEVPLSSEPAFSVSLPPRWQPGLDSRPTLKRRQDSNELARPHTVKQQKVHTYLVRARACSKCQLPECLLLTQWHSSLVHRGWCRWKEQEWFFYTTTIQRVLLTWGVCWHPKRFDLERTGERDYSWMRVERGGGMIKSAFSSPERETAFLQRCCTLEEVNQPSKYMTSSACTINIVCRTKATGNPELDSWQVDVVHAKEIVVDHKLEWKWYVGLVRLQDLVHHCSSQEQVSKPNIDECCSPNLILMTRLSVEFVAVETIITSLWVLGWSSKF